MIRIFNKSNGYEIFIDETVEGVTLMPKYYNDEDPHMWIELLGYDWGRHAESCTECGAFLADFEDQTMHGGFSGKRSRGHSYLLGLEKSRERTD